MRLQPGGGDPAQPAGRAVEGDAPPRGRAGAAGRDLRGGEDYFTHEAAGFVDLRDQCAVADARGNYSASLFADRAIATIEQHVGDRPLFLYLAFQSATMLFTRFQDSKSVQVRRTLCSARMFSRARRSMRFCKIRT